jgi:hypothetical protein
VSADQSSIRSFLEARGANLEAEASFASAHRPFRRKELLDQRAARRRLDPAEHFHSMIEPRMSD